MEQEIRPRNKWLKEVREWTLSVAVAVIVSILFQTYVYAQTEVHNVSMQNTLVDGQRLIEDKWSYRFHTPNREDIVIIHGPEYKERLVKRVIGLPGEVIDIRSGKVYVNGTKLDEPYIKGITTAEGLAMPYTVPEGHLFVMGDNRENSLDSRALGPIALTSIEGKAVFRIWPMEKFGSLK